MASLTIDELKKSLFENGVDLPVGRAKKEEYVKLYEEHIAPASALGNNFSDEEGSQGSRKVSSTMESDSQIKEAVESLSNDDLFEKLKELGYNAGPVLQNTRRVYEKKLLALIRGEVTNGVNSSVNYANDIEVSDTEIEIPRPSKRKSQERSSVVREVSREPSVARPESSAPAPVSVSAPAPAPAREPRRISYLEKIPHGGSGRIIEPSDYLASPSSSEFRTRDDVDQAGDRYVGRWSPKLHSVKTASTPVKATESIGKKIFLAVALAVLLALIAIAYTQWVATDPYAIFDESVQKEVEDLSGVKGKI